MSEVPPKRFGSSGTYKWPEGMKPNPNEYKGINLIEEFERFKKESDINVQKINEEKEMKKVKVLKQRYSVIVLKEPNGMYMVEKYHDLPMSLKKYLSGLPNAVFFRQGLDVNVASALRLQILRNKSEFGLTKRVGLAKVQLKEGISEKDFENSLQNLDKRV